MTAIAGIARVALAMLLLVAAATKAADFVGMAGIVDSYRVLPAVLTLPAAVAVTAGEAIVGGLLLAARTRLFGCVASAAMHAVYLVWSAVALTRGLTIADCGCFGTLWPRPLSVTTLVEDGVLIVLSLGLAWHYGRKAGPA